MLTTDSTTWLLTISITSEIESKKNAPLSTYFMSYFGVSHTNGR
jgi:hypothetical protein